jgi:two-component system, OmpR family, KDP operon response regulator KdpE
MSESIGTVLVVDDDPVHVGLLCGQLQAVGYRTLSATNGEEGLQAASRSNPDVVVMDVMMPVMDGWQMCERLRAQSDVPIIMLSARDDEIDKLRAFRLGADDYVTVPCSFAEVVARVGAVCARARRASRGSAVFSSGDLTIEVELRRVTVAGRTVELSNTEFRLLQLLAHAAPRPVKLETIVTETWGEAVATGFEQVKHYVWALRRKIEPDPGNPKHLLTVRGFGYRLQ